MPCGSCTVSFEKVLPPPIPKGRTALSQAPFYPPWPWEILEAFKRKWGFQRIPVDAVLHSDRPDLDPETLDLYENFMEDALLLNPVLVYDRRVPPRWILQDRLTFCVDLSNNPIEVIRSLIEDKLRTARKTLASKGELKTQRTHLSKASQYREVFDRHHRDMDRRSFGEIAREQGRPKSTVQSAYKSALRSIGSAPVKLWFQKMNKDRPRRPATNRASFEIDKRSIVCSMRKREWDASLLDGLPAQQIAADEQIADAQLKELFRTKLPEFSKTLEELDKDILQNRMLSDNPLTLNHLGAKYGMTKDRIRQLEARIITRLSDYIQKDVKDFDRLRI